MANFQSQESNPWNPFEPTQRDIQRTKELSQKNPVVAGILTFLLLPVGMIYLNRGVNSLKIIGYVSAFAFIFALASDPEDLTNEASEGIAYIGGIVATVEQVNAVTKARQRKKLYEQ